MSCFHSREPAFETSAPRLISLWILSCFPHILVPSTRDVSEGRDLTRVEWRQQCNDLINDKLFYKRDCSVWECFDLFYRGAKGRKFDQFITISSYKPSNAEERFLLELCFHILSVLCLLCTSGITDQGQDTPAHPCLQLFLQASALLHMYFRNWDVLQDVYRD